MWSACSGLGSMTQPSVVPGSGMGTSLFLPGLSQFPLLAFLGRIFLIFHSAGKARCWFSRLIVFLSRFCPNHTNVKRFGCWFWLGLSGCWGSVANLGRFPLLHIWSTGSCAGWSLSRNLPWASVCATDEPTCFL